MLLLPDLFFCATTRFCRHRGELRARGADARFELLDRVLGGLVDLTVSGGCIVDCSLEEIDRALRTFGRAGAKLVEHGNDLATVFVDLVLRNARQLPMGA